MHQSVEEKVSQPTYLPEHNISLDINVEQEKFEHQPKVEMHQSVEEKVSQPTYLPEHNISLDINVEQEEFEHQPKVEMHQSVEEKVSQPTYPPKYNISLDINVEQEEFEHQPEVEMHQSVEEKVSQPTYLPEYNISLDINVEQEKFEHQPKVEMHQSVEEKVSQPTYLPEYNISLDINVEREEFEHQPKVEMHQPVEKKAAQPTYKQQAYVKRVQQTTESFHEQPEYNISVNFNVEHKEYEHQSSVRRPVYQQSTIEHTPTVFHQPSYQPIESEYDTSMKISIEKEEYSKYNASLEPLEYEHQPETKCISPTNQADLNMIARRAQPDHVVEVKYPPHQAGSLVEHVWQNQSKQVADVVGGYNPRDLKDFVPAYGDDLDVQTPAYIPRFVSIAESVIPFQATLQRFLTGNKQLVSLPKVIKTVGALHRIKIDVKISIEKIVGTLIGYNPGLNDIVRQVYNLFVQFCPIFQLGTYLDHTITLQFYKRTVINVPNDYEVNNVALRISNLLAGAFSISHNVIYHLKSSVVSGLQLIRDVIHGRREAHNLESIINGVSVKIGVVLQKSQILLKNSHSLAFRTTLVPPASIVKEMTKCSDILPYKSYEYFNQLLSTFSGKAIPTDLSYRLVNLVRQVRNQRCADHVSLPGSLGHLKTYFPGKSFKKYHVKFALRKVFTQVAFANSVNVRLNSHLRYTVQHLLGVIQPHVLTNQQTAGDFVSSVREWASSLVHTINQPHQRHLIKRSVMKLSATFTAVLRPQQKQPPKEFTNKLLDLTVVQVLKSINSEVDTSQLQHILPTIGDSSSRLCCKQDDTLDNPSVHITSTILDLLGKEHVPEQKQLLAQRTKSILALLRNKSACLSRYSSDNAQHEIKGYINFSKAFYA
nr:unnamed protein product [Callosobruchus chinensis]